MTRVPLGFVGKTQAEPDFLVAVRRDQIALCPAASLLRNPCFGSSSGDARAHGASLRNRRLSLIVPKIFLLDLLECAVPLGLASKRLLKRSCRMLRFEAHALGENIMARIRLGPGRCRVCPGDLGPKPK